MSGETDDQPGLSAADTGPYEPADQPAYTPHYIDQSWGHHSADRNRRALARAEFADYKRRFRPIENELIGQIGNPQVYQDNVARATDSVAHAYQSGAGERRRNLSRYGATPSAAETAQYDRQMGLSQAAATAEAANRARGAVKNRNMQIMGGGLAPTDLRKPSQE